MSYYDNLTEFSDRVALITEEREKITYAQLEKEADEIVGVLDPRNIVFLVCKNCKESIFVYIGLLRKKVVPVLINNNINIQLFENLLISYKPSFIYIPEENQELGFDFQVIKTYGGYNVVKTTYNNEYEINDELALLLTTSGSTGSPKLVRQSYRNIESNAEAIADYLQISADDKAITTMPMSYTYGLSIINSHLLKGACLILNEHTLMEKEFWALLKEEKATTFGGVPYVYEMLKKLRFSRMELPSLKYITQAGGKLSAELAEEFSKVCIEKQIKLIIMYGQTEATARMSYLPWEYALSKAGSMGIAIPGGEFYLIDSDNNVINEDEIVGELIYKGNNVTLGYAEDYSDLIKGDENHGTLHTGDMARRDKDGFYYIVGRKKRFLKIFGNRINLDEVEAMLRSKGYECVCTGVDDKLHIYTTNENTESEIIQFISSQTRINSTAFKVTYIEEIPRNDSGKILYSALN
jgi:Acyl-CoA synthetases (AMP-forming)/AMP-acid ligases II